MCDEQRGLREAERHAADSLLSSHYSSLFNAVAKNYWWRSTSSHPTRLNGVQSEQWKFLIATSQLHGANYTNVPSR